MNAIKDEIRIDAPAGKVYEALTRQAGYRGWWNAAAEVPEAGIVTGGRGHQSGKSRPCCAGRRGPR